MERNKGLNNAPAARDVSKPERALVLIDQTTFSRAVIQDPNRQRRNLLRIGSAASKQGRVASIIIDLVSSSLSFQIFGQECTPVQYDCGMYYEVYLQVVLTNRAQLNKYQELSTQK
jgi:hypothetical protein